MKKLWEITPEDLQKVSDRFMGGVKLKNLADAAFSKDVEGWRLQSFLYEIGYDFIDQALFAAQRHGINAFTRERWEQVFVHGFDVSNDEDYGNGELLEAAVAVLFQGDELSHMRHQEWGEHEMWPWKSDFGMEFWYKICKKNRLEQLTVAGSFIAAEIDRIVNEQAKKNEA